MDIRVAAVQMDFNPAVFIGIDDLLREPLKCFDERPGYGIAYIPFYSMEVNERLDEFISKEIKDSYIDLLNKKVLGILEFCVSKEVDLLVFPEYSIPAATLPLIKQFVINEKKINIVAGSHTVLMENYAYYKEIGMEEADESKLALRKAISPIFHADGKVCRVEKFTRTQRMDHDFALGEIWGNITFKVNGQDITSLIYLCIDYIEDKSSKKELFRKGFENADIIIVPAYTPVIEPFERFALHCLTGYKKAVVFANAVDSGGTRIFCHFDLKTKQQLYDILDDGYGSFKMPEGEEGIIIVSLDTSKQYTEKPTSFTQQKSSIQEGVYPFVYSYTLDGFEMIKKELEGNGNYNEKKRILKSNKTIICSWMDYTKIYKRKIAKLFHNIENLRNEQIDFFLDVFYLSDEMAMLDSWRLEKVLQIDAYFDSFLKYEKLDSEWWELIFKLKVYYFKHRRKLESNKTIFERKNKIRTARHQDKKCMWIITEDIISNQLFNDWKGKRGGYAIEGIKADCADTLFENGNEILRNAHVLVITVTTSHNPFDKIKDRLTEYYRKCIIIDCENMLDTGGLPSGIRFVKRNISYINDLNNAIINILDAGEKRGL